MTIKKLTAVVIEDEEYIANALYVFLEKNGILCHSFIDPHEYRQWLLANKVKIDIIISDFSLNKKIDGVDLINETYSKYPSVISILISGYVQESIDKINSLPSSTDIIEKPFSFKEIIRRINIETQK